MSRGEPMLGVGEGAVFPFEALGDRGELLVDACFLQGARALHHIPNHWIIEL